MNINISGSFQIANPLPLKGGIVKYSPGSSMNTFPKITNAITIRPQCDWF